MKLVQPMSRGTLEEFVLSQVEAGNISMSQVAAAAGPRKKIEPVKDVLLRGGATTGLFDDLSTQIHIQIFSLVDLMTRLRLTMETCRGFRDLHQQPGVWDTLLIPFTGSGYMSSKGWMTGIGLRRLLTKIPLEGVEHLDLSHGDSASAYDLQHALQALPSLRKLGMHGKRVKGNVMKTVANASWIGQLQYLNLDSCKCDEEAICSVLRKAPSLTHLITPVSLSTEMLARIASIHSKLRGGGTSLLESLEDRGCNGSMSTNDLIGMHESFPELTCFNTRGS
jgi:hypothetical protein